MSALSKKEDLAAINKALKMGLTSINILAKGLFFLTRKVGIIVSILKSIIVLRWGK
jgi:hypothetical protein